MWCEQATLLNLSLKIKIIHYQSKQYAQHNKEKFIYRL